MALATSNCHAVAVKRYQTLLNQTEFYEKARIEGVAINDTTVLRDSKGIQGQFIDKVFAWIIVPDSPLSKSPQSLKRRLIHAKRAAIRDLLLDSPKLNLLAFDVHSKPLLLLSCYGNGIIDIAEIEQTFESSRLPGKSIGSRPGDLQV